MKKKRLEVGDEVVWQPPWGLPGRRGKIVWDGLFSCLVERGPESMRSYERVSRRKLRPLGPQEKSAEVHHELLVEIRDQLEEVIKDSRIIPPERRGKVEGVKAFSVLTCREWMELNRLHLAIQLTLQPEQWWRPLCEAAHQLSQPRRDP